MHFQNTIRVCWLLLVLFSGGFPTFAFLPATDTAGPLTLSIADPGPVTVLGRPIEMNVTVKNSGATRLEGTVRMAVIDDWRMEGNAVKPFAIEPNAAQKLSFTVVPGKRSYDALYPVHAYAEFRQDSVTLSAHAILIATVTAPVVPALASGTVHLAGQSPPPAAAAAATPPKPESEAKRLARQQALEQAKEALQGKLLPWSWKLESEAGTTGVSIVPGPAGIADGFIAFADSRHELVFEGFTEQVEGRQVGVGRTDLLCTRLVKQFDAGRGTLISYVAFGSKSVPLQASVWAEKGALRVAFSMPEIERDPRGPPRFTALAIGPSSELAHRVYAGFGNVIQDPSHFDLPAGGFMLSTRHIGIDFKNGLSLVQATDIFPDRFLVDPDRQTYALFTHNDATFSFIPSSHEAFAAARVYHDLVNFKPAGGVANLLGRLCLDQWGGDYRRAAQDLETASRYGLTDAVFVKHVWQHWGYDYRLPDIYPPSGNFDDFRAMVEACKRNGILFCPHDNYIDFYPDATGFSYDHVWFNADGTPQKAWLNKGREAQSYRWSPNSFDAWLKMNLKKLNTGFAPTAYFLDVFGAMAPADFYDFQGRFYPKTVTAERWGEAFDHIREILGNNAPTLSEAGQDGLIGHLDAGESDHCGWLPDIKDQESHFRWSMQAGDGERIPWHDMASHGSFVLLAGGLGSRYAGGQDEILHGYGSDDYLSLTVLGGRNPMCDGPLSRRAVMTYWLLHDVCKPLAHDEMLAHEFAGDDIHRQIVRFSNGGTVQVNRGKSDWTSGGRVLPSFGFIANAGGNEAGITRRKGVISAYAKSPGILFVDARPNVSGTEGHAPANAERSARLNLSGKLVDFGPAITNGAFRLMYAGIHWQLVPLPESLAFSVELRLDQLEANGFKVTAINAVDADGNSLGPVKFKQEGQSLVFETAPKVFAYHLEIGK